MEEKNIVEALKMLVDYAEDGYMIMDRKGVVLYHNFAYLRAVSMEMESMIGHNLREYIERGDIKRSSALMALEQKKKVSMLTVIRDNKTAFVTSTPVIGKDGVIEMIMTHARDNTELSDLKKQIRMLDEYAAKLDVEGRNGLDYGSEVVVVSKQMQGVFALADKVKSVGSTVMLLGESGVGKDVVAKFIHANGTLKDKPYIAVNCSALPEHLLESELFGYTGGSFTGAKREGKKGLFEAAHNGVLFLDEIGDISPNLQAKLLRAIESKTITRVGDYAAIPVNTRIITATNKNLPKMVKEGTFREDLYYRLNVVTISIPPLRERRDDIRPLIFFYLNRYNHMYNMTKMISKEAMMVLQSYQWPGNIRELKNMVERMVVTSDNDTIGTADLSFFGEWDGDDDFPDTAAGDAAGNAAGREAGDAVSVSINKLMPLAEAVEYMERQLLEKAKAELRTSRKIAKELEVSRATISRKLHKYHINEA